MGRPKWNEKGKGKGRGGGDDGEDGRDLVNRVMIRKKESQEKFRSEYQGTQQKLKLTVPVY